MDLEKEDKLQEPSVTIDESFAPYFSDVLTPGEVKQQLRVGAEVLDTSTNPYFGDGSSGDLYIKSGETVSLASGVYNYYNFTIESGGTLTAADTTNPFVIKVKGTTTINGTIAFNEKDLSFRSATTIPNQLGEEIIVGGTGVGGSGGNTFGATGGVSTEGIGGGGAGGYASKTTTYYGGNGGTGTPSVNSGGASTQYINANNLTVAVSGQNGGNGRGGSGGFVAVSATFTIGQSGGGGDGHGGIDDYPFGAGQDGGQGYYTNLTLGDVGGGGGGGGGGGRGKNGANLILIANKLSGTGTINCSGGNGRNGGNGGTGGGSAGMFVRDGGAGGGGGGGGAGALVIAYEGDSSGLTLTNTIGTGGTGGNNGANGTSGTKIVKKLSETY